MPQTAQTQPTKRSTRVPTRTYQLRQIHSAARDAGYETREDKPGRAKYEARLMELIGRTSSRQATRSERELLIRAFQAEVMGGRCSWLLEAVSDDEALDVLGW